MSINKVSNLIEEVREGELTELNLSNLIDMEGLPDELWECTSLRRLDLSDNDLDNLSDKISNLKGLEVLDLSKNQLEEISDSIFGLEKLRELRLAYNYLGDLSPKIKSLKNLEILDISNNAINGIPESIGYCTNLIQFYADSCDLRHLPDSFSKLEKLITLSLDDNYLLALPSNLKALINLEVLYLRDNEFFEFPETVLNLTNLTNLDLSSNGFEEIHEEIGSLSRLEYLFYSDNLLDYIPESIADLQSLVYLGFSDNLIVEITDEITSLTKLNVLLLSGNKINKINPNIENLENLETLMLSSNNLSDLPLSSIRKLTHLKKIGLQDNNNLTIPPEILGKENAPQRILDFYETVQSGKTRALNEAKMILVGQGSVGKTSLVKRIIDNEFNSSEEMTEGISIRQWKISSNEKSSEKIKINVWDFGGQEIMHATHQFFLTKRSLYLLVLDCRMDEDENRLEYWLKIIESFGEDSPVIVVGNKCDEKSLDLDQSGLEKKYENIKAFIQTSCDTSEGIEKLKLAIASEIRKLEHVHDELSDEWLTVKSNLEALDKDFIAFDEYKKLCRQEKITKSSNQNTLIDFLNDLGIVINFIDDPRLEYTYILNPEWITNGVYKIINSNELFLKKGILDFEDLGTILDLKKYPKDKHLFIMDIMSKFELCFPFEGDYRNKYLIPDLLTKDEPYTGEWQDATEFQFHYDVLPNSIMSRFIVRNHKLIFKNTYWRRGVIIEKFNNRAFIKADIEDKKIIIKVEGRKSGRRDLLAVIRAEFDGIHKTIPGLNPKEKIPIPDSKNVVVDYNHLIDLLRIGQDEVFPENLSRSYNIRQLIYSVDEVKEAEKASIEDIPNYKNNEKQKDTVDSHKEAPVIKANNPWLSGSFYYLGFMSIFITVILILLWKNVSLFWSISISFSISLIATVVIGALQLRNDEKLSEAGLITIVQESFKKIVPIKTFSKEPKVRAEETTD